MFFSLGVISLLSLSVVPTSNSKDDYLGGGWAEKSGFVNTYGHYTNTNAPETASWNGGSGQYNSDLFYFAIQQNI